MQSEREAVERYQAHADVMANMKPPGESPYTYIEVSTGAAGMVDAAWNRDAHTLARAYLARLADDAKRDEERALPITDERLIALGATFIDTEGDYLTHRWQLSSWPRFGIWRFNDTPDWCIYEYDNLTIQTMGQLLDLLSALGIDAGKGGGA